MNDAELIALIERLRKEPDETEWLEFKANYHGYIQLAEDLSALANSACYHNKNKAYLIFGIEDKTHEIVGASFNPYKEKAKGNEGLQLWLTSSLQPNMGFQIHTCLHENKRIVLFEINPAVDCPVKFNGVAYIRIGSSTTKLNNHPEIERAIWERKNKTDWSAEICPQATLSDLDKSAIQKARAEFKNKFPDKKSEVDSWDDVQFLNKAKITIKGAITNTAVLLLGKPEAATLLTPAMAEIFWILKDENNQEKDHAKFGPPFLLNVDEVFAKIRNLTYRYLPSGTLFPIETTQYDSWVVREALHNCIAHQDYSLRGRINVVENPDSLTFTNVGSFLPGSIETVIKQDAPQEVYRNPFLSSAMFNLNMIDTQGGGIKKMFQIQRKRLFPLPDYALSQADRVVVRIRGEILDEKYTKLLIERTDLDLWTVILLDKVQKKVHVTREQHKHLKSLKVIEGRYPNIFVSSRIAAVTGEKAQYIRDRGLDKKHYKELIIELVHKQQPVTRNDIDKLLMDKLPEILNEQRKRTKIHNLISELAGKQIKNIGSRRRPKWILFQSKDDEPITIKQ